MKKIAQFLWAAHINVGGLAILVPLGRFSSLSILETGSERKSLQTQRKLLFDSHHWNMRPFLEDFPQNLDLSLLFVL